jgi:HlyD family secretion protein
MSSAFASCAARLERRRALVLIASLTIAALAALVYRLERGTVVAAYVVARGDVVQTVVASGRIVNPLRIDIASQITGAVVRVPVREGQAVAAGQVLIELDGAEPRAQVEQARAALAQAEGRLRQLLETTLPSAQQSLRQARANLVDAQHQYERTRELQATGFVGPAQLDDAKRNLEVSESQAHAAQLLVDDNGPHGNARHVAQMAVDQARAALQVAQANLDRTIIRTPLAGTLISRDVERGDVVSPGKALMVLSPSGETQVVVQVDEKNLSLIQLGQRALASADAYPSQRFDAQVAYINPGIDAQRGSVEVKLAVPSAPEYLRQDMTVSVDIEVARHAGALAVPGDALHDAAAGRPWVWRVTEGRAHRQAVHTGVRGDLRIEIVGGLHPGDVVLAGPAGAIQEGQRVRARLRDWQGLAVAATP